MLKLKLTAISLAVSSIAGCESVPQLQGALACGIAGAALGAALGDDEAALAGGLIGAAACGIWADLSEKKRKAALEREHELDAQIAKKTARNQDLLGRNASLQTELNQLESRRYILAKSVANASDDELRLKYEVAGKAAAVPEQTRILKERIAKIDELIAGNQVPADQVAAFRTTQVNLKKRIDLLNRYASRAHSYNTGVA